MIRDRAFRSHGVMASLGELPPAIVLKKKHVWILDSIAFLVVIKYSALGSTFTMMLVLVSPVAKLRAIIS